MSAAALLQLSAARREPGPGLPGPLMIFKRREEAEFLNK